MRKSFLTFMLTLLTGVLFAQQPTRENVAEGTLEGINESGVKTFKGIPFAAPPVGDLRWKAPQPVEKWQGVRQAKEFGPNPMQENVFGDMNFGTKKMSEDCLYLNIWTPAKKMNEKLPVLIYFNGGGLWLAVAASHATLATQWLVRASSPLQPTIAKAFSDSSLILSSLRKPLTKARATTVSLTRWLPSNG